MNDATTYKLSRCKGSRTCWQATVGPGDYSCGTDYDLGHLIETLWARSRHHGESPEFVLIVTAEGEEAARADRQEREGERLDRETKAAQRTIRDNKKRVAELATG